MKAIITKYLPATNSKGARIKASAYGIKPLTMPEPDAQSDEAAHRAAAVALCERQGWPIQLAAGGLPDQTGFAFCFAETVA